ncbi:unnamed protein product [Arabis nemorensis]|uniref:Uncharacterized protein n=1 Tax=Arabis nemorensis TaxID=586526 RepID=A0A565BCJ1_9BRAS|nr:unnamed protein product [Arabis nemorensis]
MGTEPSAPTAMSIEEFVSQPGRDRLTRLDPHLPPNTTWFQYSGNGITSSINAMINSLITKPYPTYSSMPVADQETWFRQFAQEFNWDP